MDKNNKQTKMHELYPYDSNKLAIIFVYGTDFQRKLNILLIPMSIWVVSILIILFMCLAAIALHTLRKKFHLRRVDHGSTLIDILIVFIACGNLRIYHKWERLFFLILFNGAFFLTPIFSSEILSQVYRMRNRQINTFEQLTEIDSPIFINPTLATHEHNVCEMLRLGISN